jgi:hypothetical protein
MEPSADVEPDLKPHQHKEPEYDDPPCGNSCCNGCCNCCDGWLRTFLEYFCCVRIMPA